MQSLRRNDGRATASQWTEACGKRTSTLALRAAASAAMRSLKTSSGLRMPRRRTRCATTTGIVLRSGESAGIVSAGPQAR